MALRFLLCGVVFTWLCASASAQETVILPSEAPIGATVDLMRSDVVRLTDKLKAGGSSPDETPVDGQVDTSMEIALESETVERHLVLYLGVSAKAAFGQGRSSVRSSRSVESSQNSIYMLMHARKDFRGEIGTVRWTNEAIASLNALKNETDKVRSFLSELGGYVVVQRKPCSTAAVVVQVEFASREDRQAISAQANARVGSVVVAANFIDVLKRNGYSFKARTWTSTPFRGIEGPDTERALARALASDIKDAQGLETLRHLLFEHMRCATPAQASHIRAGVVPLHTVSDGHLIDKEVRPMLEGRSDYSRLDRLIAHERRVTLVEDRRSRVAGALADGTVRSESRSLCNDDLDRCSSFLREADSAVKRFLSMQDDLLSVGTPPPFMLIRHLTPSALARVDWHEYHELSAPTSEGEHHVQVRYWPVINFYPSVDSEVVAVSLHFRTEGSTDIMYSNTAYGYDWENSALLDGLWGNPHRYLKSGNFGKTASERDREKHAFLEWARTQEQLRTYHLRVSLVDGSEIELPIGNKMRPPVYR